MALAVPAAASPATPPPMINTYAQTCAKMKDRDGQTMMKHIHSKN